MTIYTSQGKTMKICGLDLENPCFGTANYMLHVRGSAKHLHRHRLRHGRAQYHQLTARERDRNVELFALGLSLRTIATRVGHNVSTIQRCIT
ncbi:hypothetical protein TNCV_2450221 [Trichonephila clavipes]|nr:hypothetical protein TNCV_2450221 [Trichonephila clavipes]